MAIPIASNLYPPIVMDTQPAFVGNSCTIYYGISSYNSLKNISGIHVSIIDLKTNKSIFKDSPTGIHWEALSEGGGLPNSKYPYAITIENKNFKPDTFYKIQLRFSNSSNKEEVNSDSQMSAHQNNYSEWSKICLIKNINPPNLTIKGFQDLNNDLNSIEQETIFTTSNIDIIGNLSFENTTANTEYLKSYQILLFNNNKNLIFDSGEIYSNTYDPNNFNYTIPLELLDTIEYTLKFKYTTNNLYSNFKEYSFTVLSNGIDRLNASIQAKADEENGRMIIHIKSNTTDRFLGNLTIRRTSSKSNFHIWEDIKTIVFLQGTLLDLDWYDNTIESGIWYKYCVQKRNSNGDRGQSIVINNPVICILEHIFLTNQNAQLKIKFNPSLNEFKYNVTESQQVAIGAKYPYINRNANNYFRTFPIGGLISSFIDTTDWYDPHYYEDYPGDNKFIEQNEIGAFTTKHEIYGDSYEYYKEYNTNNNITEYNDYIYERQFRQKVFDFLYANDVKLFRSTTEGNILIKLMNIDFQPVESLGRYLYSFTANAVEIDEANISNYNKYKIQQIGEYSNYITYTHDVPGFIKIEPSNLSSENNLSYSINIIEKIKEKIKNSQIEGFEWTQNMNNNCVLKYLKIQIESEPYVVEDMGDKLRKQDNNSNSNNKFFIGYNVQINNKDILILPTLERNPLLSLNTKSPQEYEIIGLGFYELKGDNVQIYQLALPNNIAATVEYVIQVTESEKSANLIHNFKHFSVAGQLYEVFRPEMSLFSKIYKKYYIENKNYYQRLISIDSIQIETDPGTIIYIKDSKTGSFSKQIIANGYLQLKDDDIHIEGFYFFGKHLIKGDNPNRLENNEYYQLDEQTIYQSIFDIENPLPNYVYKVADIYYLNAISFNNTTGQITVDENEVLKNSDNEYRYLILHKIQQQGLEYHQYIYYNNQWCLFTEDQEILCPVEGTVNYLCEVLRGEYNNNE